MSQVDWIGFLIKKSMSLKKRIGTQQPSGVISRLALPLAGLKIGSRLALCFAVLLGLVAASDLTALWQCSRLSDEVSLLYSVDQKSATVEQIHTDIVDYANLEGLAEAEDPGPFAQEAERLSETLRQRIDAAMQAIQIPGAATRQDPVLLTMLASIQGTLPSQTATLVALAKAGDWHAVHMRLDKQESALGKLTGSVAREVEAEVGEQRERVLADTRRRQRRVFLVLPLTVLLTLVAAGFLSAVVTRTITAPLASLDHAAQAMAEGDFSRQVPVAGQDELANLGRVFNNSSLRLRSYYSALQQSEAKFRSYIENSPIGIFVVDRDGRIVDFNQAVAQLLAYEPELFRQITIHRIVANAHEFALNDFLALPANCRVTAEWELQSSDGRTIPVTLQGVGLHGGLAMAYLFDLTERRQAELERDRLRAQFLQAQKMESIGRLASGVAHDFNNLLTVINGYSQMLLAKLSAGDRLRDNLTEIHKAGERAAGLTRQLLAYSRKQVLQPRRLDLNRVVQEMQPMLERLVGEDVKMQVALGAASATVHADPHQLEQVMMNLAVNARDAMPGGGRLRIETADVELDESYASLHPEARVGRYVMLAVSDSGIGMDETTRQRIFEPFFTTKETGTGTGLGLSMVQGIVAQSDGWINVYSQPGDGTTFKIYLPAPAETIAAARTPVSVPVLGGQETVLVVEDQAEVRKYAVKVLKEYGYRVIAAENGDQALVLCEQDRDRIHLVLTDVVMPNMSGRELADRLKQMRPGMKVLFMSGYTDDIILRHGILEESAQFIEKPFSPEELARKIRSVLEPLRGARILVADDEALVRGFLRAVLQEAGYEVLEAANGKEALQQVRAEPVDLVITDLAMPEQEGLETIRALRRDVPGVRIIAISGAFGGQFLKPAQMLGADAVLSKPASAEMLLARVAEVLKLRR